jgi:hypothetical protein
MPEKDVLHKLNIAIDAFEKAVKSHEHVGMLDSEVLLREELERARTRLCGTVSTLIEQAKQD